ncbi:ANTAR domain-containing protein [Microbacterium sp. SD291]|uniref:ANTAR domain-containing protein n=1 Tax=Microbacterium sp. SD291 TaxID=2782007 RepID=UPI001A971FC1|nr:ANTAR domain-containing protein [Microbacterium sp. SD291]MBO0979024.1 ANTAR domain-containing protein [Microbacterium sp. SD291]
MTALEREKQLLRTFTELADTLVDDYDVVELMQHLVDTCRDQLHVSAAGLLLSDDRGELELVASTSEAAAVVEALLDGSRESLVAIPLRLRDKTIGSLKLIQAEDDMLTEADLVIARALADIATIGILHERTLRETEALTQQLQHALSSRVLIEQAKGVVSYTNGVPIDDAFTLIRTYARNHGEHLGDVARRIVERRLTLS